MIVLKNERRQLDREFRKVSNYFDGIVDELGISHARNVGKALMAETMVPFAAALRTATPVKEGNLRRSIRIKAFATKPTKRRGVLLGARCGYTSQISGRKPSPRKAREGQFLAVEFGTQYIRGRRMMGRTVESQGVTVIKRLGDNLSRLQALSAKTLANKTSEIRAVLK